ncbi:MAG: response regulator receiver modulated diguanylate cyclase [Frankiales bacterium]|nr:response regulator receiver modulated diguanylate cyclase [Frankiales bacterium]
MGGRILLVADAGPDGSDVARHLGGELRSRGHEVEQVRSAAAVDRAMASRPDLLVLEAGGHSAEVVRQLRADPMTAWLPIVVLTERADAVGRALLLASGADDCVTAPYDPLELTARIEGTLHRMADIRSLSPLTGLPGNHRIEVEVATRAASRQPFALCHVDLDEFKGFNDAYGFQRGDQLLLLLAACLQRAVQRSGDPGAFLGHVGGDDFVVVCKPESAESLCGSVLDEFGRLSLAHYDEADAGRGHLRTVDRRGELRCQPLVSVSVGMAVHRGGPADHRRLVAIATEMKAVAKRQPGSYIALDRRG